MGKMGVGNIKEIKFNLITIGLALIVGLLFLLFFSDWLFKEEEPERVETTIQYTPLNVETISDHEYSRVIDMVSLENEDMRDENGGVLILTEERADREVFQYYLSRYDYEQKQIYKKKIEHSDLDFFNSVHSYSEAVIGERAYILLSSGTKIFKLYPNDEQLKLEEIALDDFEFSHIENIIPLRNTTLGESGYLVFGRGSSYHNLAVDNNASIVKLNKDLTVDWINFFESERASTFTDAIQFENSGELVVVGHRYKCSYIKKTPCKEGIIVKYDMYNGKMVYEQDTDVALNKLSKDKQTGELVAVGSMWDSLDNDDTTWQQIATMIKIEPETGETIWKQHYKLNNDYHTAFVDLTLNSGSIITLGSFTENVGSESHGFIAEYDDEGNLNKDAKFKHHELREVFWLETTEKYAISGTKSDSTGAGSAFYDYINHDFSFEQEAE